MAKRSTEKPAKRTAASRSTSAKPVKSGKSTQARKTGKPSRGVSGGGALTHAAKKPAIAPRADTMRPFALSVSQLLNDRHCDDIRLLDVRGLSQVCDYVLVATGTSDRQMRSIAQELEDVGEDAGHTVFRSSRDDASTWIVIDFVDMVVHLFEPNQRAYYDIESLWSDAEAVNWRREASKSPSESPSPRARRDSRS